MVSGETLLKITDFPFAYSLVGILSLWIGVSLSDDKYFVVLAAAGTIGTLLAISNPVGRFLQNSLNAIFKKKKNSEFEIHNLTKFEYCKRAIDSKSIKLELDKIVSLFYFLFILALFTLAILFSDDLIKKLIFIDNENVIICNKFCLLIVIPPITVSFLFILVFVLKKDWRKIINYTEIAGIQQYGISSEFVTRSTIENMTKAVDQNDWATAKEWSNIVVKEIQTKKGQRDKLIKDVEEIYRPLYIESTEIETQCKQIEQVGDFKALPQNEWSKIKARAFQIRIDDLELKNNLEEMYNKIKEFNAYPDRVRFQAREIYGRKLIETYGPNRDIQFFVKNDDGEGATPIPNLLPLGKHPLDINKEKNPIPSYIHVNNTKANKITKLTSENDFIRFNNFLKAMLDEAAKNPIIKQARNLFSDIRKENKIVRGELIQKFESL